MTNKELCLKLLHADTELEVIGLLDSQGYWGNEAAWRFYGDNEMNFSIAGNQQASSDAALVEKIVNALDARLLGACVGAGIDPVGPGAPQSIPEAVTKFFGGVPPAKLAQGTTVTATGYKPQSGNPCITICDSGEGQTPDELPATFLSLPKDASRKARIPFVQGKFNMGSTGVLRFCGKNNLQLIISKRDPRLLGLRTQRDEEWGFTVVRRESATNERLISTYTYLAPLESDVAPRLGRVLSFSANALPFFPLLNKPYERDAEWGTSVKLYEYQPTGYSRSNILRKGGLLRRVDLLLPKVALPVRFHECRDFRGHAGSFDTSLTGIVNRLEEASSNLEEGFPNSAQMVVEGETFGASIYAFKKGMSDTYKGKTEGILFVFNGQTQGILRSSFFQRVGMSYLADSLLVVLDCSMMSPRKREDLIANSRDRLANTEFRKRIEEELAELLKSHSGLRELREQRRRADVEDKLVDSKPLEEILQKIIQKSPSLSSLFLSGLRLSSPFKSQTVAASDHKFVGRHFPTYFRFKGQPEGEQLKREAHLNSRSKISFETDVENDYFTRTSDPGNYLLRATSESLSEISIDSFINLREGVATLNLTLPDTVEVGSELYIEITVHDSAHIDPFSNSLVLKVFPEKVTTGGSTTKPRVTPSDETGKDSHKPQGIQLPKVKLIRESDWASQNPPFDKYTALRVKHAGLEDADGKSIPVFDFYLNEDNIYARTELKHSKLIPEIVRARFRYAMILLGLAMIHNHLHISNSRSKDAESEDETELPDLETEIERVTSGIAAVILPTIDELGGLTEETSKMLNSVVSEDED